MSRNWERVGLLAIGVMLGQLWALSADFSLVAEAFEQRLTALNRLAEVEEWCGPRAPVKVGTTFTNSTNMVVSRAGSAATTAIWFDDDNDRTPPGKQP